MTEIGTNTQLTKNQTETRKQVRDGTFNTNDL